MNINISLINIYQKFHLQKREELNHQGWKIEVSNIVGSEKPSCTVLVYSNVFMAQFCLWASGELNFEYLLIEKSKPGHYFQYEIKNEEELIQKLSDAYAILEGIKKPHSL